MLAARAGTLTGPWSKPNWSTPRSVRSRSAATASAWTTSRRRRAASKPKLYRHFGDRAGLYSAIAARLGSMIWDSAQSTLFADTEGSSVDDLFQSSIAAYVGLVDDHPVLFRFLMTNHMFDGAQSADGNAAEQLRSVMDIVSGEFARSLRRGCGRVSRDPRRRIHPGSGRLRHTMVDRSGRSGSVSRSPFATHILETSWGIIDPRGCVSGCSFPSRRAIRGSGLRASASRSVMCSAHLLCLQGSLRPSLANFSESVPLRAEPPHG